MYYKLARPLGLHYNHYLCMSVRGQLVKMLIAGCAHYCQLIIHYTGNSAIVGYALYFFTYSTWEGSSLYLEDLYVKPSHRGTGIGTALWREIAKVRTL